MDDIRKEDYISESPDPVPLYTTEKIAEQMKYSVCRICTQKTKGTGFFVKIPYKSKKLPVLMTNNHVINKIAIDNNIKITLQLNNGKVLKNLIIDNNRLTFTDKKLDVTIIEIKENIDNLENNYLELDEYTNDYKLEPNILENLYNGESIYLMGYPEIKGNKGLNIFVSYGKSPKFEDTDIIHYCSTNDGSSGSPILKINNQKIIGIHHSSVKDKCNKGTLLIYAIKKFQDIENNKQNINKNEKQLNNNELNNYITCEFDIKENKDIRIINSYEQFHREYNNTELKKDCENEKEIKDNCEIRINDKIINKFSYFHKFDKKGKYTIKYFFKKNMNRIDYMFYECTSLTEIDFSHFNSEDIINTSGIFCKCSSLIKVNLSKFNTSKIYDMSGMFCKCTSLEKVDLSNFKTNNTTKMSGMFCKCSSLTNIDLSSFNTNKVTDMSCMFYECKSLTNIDLSNFSTNKDTDMSGLFIGCNKLSKIIMNHLKY